MSIQLKRCNEATRINSNTVLESGQPLYETDTKLLYIGDGTTEAKNLQSVNSKLNIKNGTAVATVDGQQVSGGSVISASLYDDDAKYTEEQLPKATGHESFAWGKNCKALGKRCLAFGNGAQATGNTSIALGQTLLSDRNGAFVTGQGHITHREYQTIVGRYADSAGNSDKMFQVGNGADDLNRHDAFAVVSGSYYKNGVTDKNLGYAIAGSTPDNRDDALTRVDWVKKYAVPRIPNDTHSAYITLNINDVYSSKLITSDSTKSSAVLRDGNGFIKVGDISNSVLIDPNWQDIVPNVKCMRGYTYSKTETDTKDATTLSSAKTYTDTKIGALDYSASGASNKTITSISQTDGKISATFSNISYPVTSVDGKTGDVRISHPVTSVCGKTGDVKLDKSDVGLDKVDNTSDAEKKTNFTGSIASGNTGFVKGGDVYSWFSYLHDIQFESASIFQQGGYPTVEFSGISLSNVFMLTIGKTADNQAVTGTTYILAHMNESYSQELTIDSVKYTLTGLKRGSEGCLKVVANDKNVSFAACLIHMY